MDTQEIPDKASGITPYQRKRIYANAVKRAELMTLLKMSEAEVDIYGVVTPEEKRQRKLLPQPTQADMVVDPEGRVVPLHGYFPP